MTDKGTKMPTVTLYVPFNLALQAAQQLPQLIHTTVA